MADVILLVVGSHLDEQIEYEEVMDMGGDVLNLRSIWDGMVPAGTVFQDVNDKAH